MKVKFDLVPVGAEFSRNGNTYRKLPDAYSRSVSVTMKPKQAGRAQFISFPSNPSLNGQTCCINRNTIVETL